MNVLSLKSWWEIQFLSCVAKIKIICLIPGCTEHLSFPHLPIRSPWLPLPGRAPGINWPPAAQKTTSMSGYSQKCDRIQYHLACLRSCPFCLRNRLEVLWSWGFVWKLWSLGFQFAARVLPMSRCSLQSGPRQRQRATGRFAIIVSAFSVLLSLSKSSARIILWNRCFVFLFSRVLGALQHEKCWFA